VTDRPNPADDHFAYVLRCRDDSLYTGYTTDVERRTREHDAGEGASYTRGRTPVELVHVEGFGSRSAAMRREHEIKTLSRAEKERLVETGGVPGWVDLPPSLVGDDAREHGGECEAGNDDATRESR
jgi:putative endonuclease